MNEEGYPLIFYVMLSILLGAVTGAFASLIVLWGATVIFGRFAPNERPIRTDD